MTATESRAQPHVEIVSQTSGMIRISATGDPGWSDTFWDWGPGGGVTILRPVGPSKYDNCAVTATATHVTGDWYVVLTFK